MKAQELISTIKKDNLAPLYLITGEEELLRDEAVATIKAAVLGQGDGQGDGLGAFNYDLLYGDESDAAEILVRAREAPVFTHRRLVLVKAADKLPAREGEALLPYIKAPCDSTTLVFVAPKLDGRLKFSQALKERAVSVDCSALPEAHLPGWIRAEARRLGVRLSEEAVLLLQDLAGDSLYRVRRELEKLAAFVPGGSVVGAAEVEAVRGGEARASVFDLAAAIGAQDRGRALRILVRSLEAGEAPVRILGSLAWQYRQIWKAKDLLHRGGTEPEAARLLRVPPFKVRQFLGRFSERMLRSAFQMFAETDSRLKGGSAGAPERILESLVLSLCDGAGQTRPGGEARRGPKDPAQAPVRPAPVPAKPIRTVRTVRSGRPSAN